MESLRKYVYLVVSVTLFFYKTFFFFNYCDLPELVAAAEMFGIDMILELGECERVSFP